MYIRTMIAAVVAFSFVAVGAADAASKNKRKYRHYGGHAGAYAYMPAAPFLAPTAGPPWAQPWECFTDEGYGRYRPCSAGRR